MTEAAPIRNDISRSIEHGFGTSRVHAIVETASTAMAERQRAEIQARYIMALQNPRNVDDARVRLLAACKRPGFAESAVYDLPRGDKTIGGLSIRFAEAAVREMRNIAVDAVVVYEDASTRRTKVSVVDLETNATYSRELTISKRIERKKTRKTDTIIAERETSTGDLVFIVVATDDEVNMAEQSQVSRAIRTLGLRLIDGDILDECYTQCRRTLTEGAKKDPEGERRRVCDAFAEYGVKPSDLARFLGIPLEQIQPAHLTELRSVYNRLRDGEATWAQLLAQKSEGSVERQEPEASTTDEGAANRIKRKVEKGKAAGKVGRKALDDRYAELVRAEATGDDQLEADLLDQNDQKAKDEHGVPVSGLSDEAMAQWVADLEARAL